MLTSLFTFTKCCGNCETGFATAEKQFLAVTYEWTQIISNNFLKTFQRTFFDSFAALCKLCVHAPLRGAKQDAADNLLKWNDVDQRLIDEAVRKWRAGLRVCSV